MLDEFNKYEIVQESNFTVINKITYKYLDNEELYKILENTKKILNLENEINDNFKFLNMNNISSIQGFLESKTIYENELSNMLLDIKENFKSYINDKKFLENSFINFKDKISIFNLTQENKKMVSEIEVYKNICDFFVKETNRFLKKWHSVLKAGDPYYNINLTRHREDFSPRG